MNTRIFIRVGMALSLSGVSLLPTGCAMVHQKDREFLADPVMNRAPDKLEGSLDGDNFPRREGSTGGSSGAGGGCGC
jgi:hypothetical protein